MSAAVSKDPARAAAREARRDRRALARIGRRVSRDALRAWHDERRAAADARRKEAREAPPAPVPYRVQVEHGAFSWQLGNRGVDRVPERLSTNPLQRPPAPYEPVDERPDRQVDSRLGVVELVAPDGKRTKVRGNHATRRAYGQRGHSRRPRRRELPGAVERRLERRRKEWLS